MNISVNVHLLFTCCPRGSLRRTIEGEGRGRGNRGKGGRKETGRERGRDSGKRKEHGSGKEGDVQGTLIQGTPLRLVKFLVGNRNSKPRLLAIIENINRFFSCFFPVIIIIITIVITEIFSEKMV